MWKFALYSSVKETKTNASRPHHNKDVDALERNGVSKHASDSHYFWGEKSEEVVIHDETQTTLRQPKPRNEPLVSCCGKVKRFFRKSHVDRKDSFLEKFLHGRQGSNGEPVDTGTSGIGQKFIDEVKGPKMRSCFLRIKNGIIYPSSSKHYLWLVVISLAILYNMVLIIARVVFTQLQTDYLILWKFLDYICDLIYIMDMIIKFRTGYLENGIMERDCRKLALKYMHTLEFKFDVISILPTDILYVFVGFNPYVRLNRLLRWQRIREFFDRTIRKTSYPNLFRILNLVVYILVIIHWNACMYYAISGLIGYGSDGWVYPAAIKTEADSLSRKYIYSFYWSTLTLLTIGETPHPEKDVEYLFVVADFLIGVLIFATIVGNVGSMITNMNHDRSVFTQRLDAAKRYMKIRKVNSYLESKIIGWFDYVWINKESLGDEDILSSLPEKLRAEIGIHVHMETLRQINLFKDCEPGLLVELVLKLKQQVFSPGDYVCKKGDIGREMYIVKKGVLKVFDDDGQLYATLTSGNVFGEISVLEVPGSKHGKRRIANVMSVGYSDCFVLSKSDLWSLLVDYPVARKKLLDRGRDILAMDNMLHEEDTQSQTSCGTSVSLQDLTSTNPIWPKMRSMEDNMESLENRVCEFMRAFSDEQAKLKSKVCSLEAQLKTNKAAFQKCHKLITVSYSSPEDGLPTPDTQG